jgi:hypothetical protein
VVPICDKSYVPYLKEDAINLWISGMEINQAIFKNIIRMDDDGNMHIQQMGLTLPGVEIDIRPVKKPATSPLGAKLAYGRQFDSWNQMNIWPWGYLKYNDELQRLRDNNTVIMFRARRDDLPGRPPNTVAFDADSYDHHPVIKAAIYNYFDDIAPYTYNIYYDNGGDGIHNLDLDDSSTEGILADLDMSICHILADLTGQSDHVPSFDQVDHFKDDDPDLFDVWAHWLLLPGCDIINETSGSSLGMDYWRTIKNCQFDNATMAHTSEEANPVYNSCVITNAICIHSEADVSDNPDEMTEDGQYQGPIYARVLNIDKSLNDPSVVMSFHTDGFGQNGKGQASHAIIRFQLEVPTGNLEIVKNLTWPNTDSNLEFSYEITLRDENNNLVSKTYSGVTFTDGKATVKVSADSSPKRIEKIPAGFTYDVVELEHPDYTLVASSGTSDTIVKDETKTAEFTNARKTGNLEITKKLTGHATDSNLEFSYEVTLRDENDNPVSRTYSGVTFTNGKATVKVSANSSPKRIEAIPARFKYNVVELEHPDYELVTSSGTSGTIVKDETKTTEFTNKRKVGYNTVEKKLTF